MARTKKIVNKPTPTIEKVVEVEEQVTENLQVEAKPTPTIEKVVEVAKKNKANCEVLVSFNDRQEFGGEFQEKGSLIYLKPERLENAINGRLVKSID